MVRRRFSRPPAVGSSSRAPITAPKGDLTAAELLFKRTYVWERSFLEKLRGGKEYRPSPSYDGDSRWDTPEEKPVQNAWHAMFAKIQSKTGKDPSIYIRILFKVLRGSAVAIPTLKQVVSHKMLTLVEEYLQGHVLGVRQQFVAEGQRAKTAITIGQRGTGYPLSLSVYYAITDSRLGLSPMFKYCLAVGTSETCRSKDPQDPHCEKLDRLAKQWELYAAMDYTLFPSHYDEVWGDTVPPSFRVAAINLVRSAIMQSD